jgi:CRP-like cAMP-binding protein
MADFLDIAREGPIERVPAGHEFFHAGDHGAVMYVVIEGEAQIMLRGRVLETVRRGGIFGEMALVDQNDRSAGVVAHIATTVAAIDEARFRELVAGDPSFALAVMKIMAARLRHLDDLL